MHTIKAKKTYYKYQSLIFNRYNSLGTRMENAVAQRISDFIDVVLRISMSQKQLFYPMILHHLF